MVRKAKAWFGNLSKVGKIVTVLVVGFVLLAVGGASADDTVTTKTETVTQPIAFSTIYQEDESLLTSETKTITNGVDGSKQVTYEITLTNGTESSRRVTNETVVAKPVDAVAAKGVKQITTETATEPIPFIEKTVYSASLDKGTTQETTAGVNGVKTITYEVTKIRGTETARTKTTETVTTEPITKVVSVGTKSKPVAATPSGNCDPNYSGCVPIASDVDCAGGSGNGPAYVAGPIRVIGIDIYGLDRDGNGVGCE